MAVLKTHFQNTALMTKVLLFTLSFFFATLCFSQQFKFSKEIAFSKYLQDKEEYNESFLVLSSIDTSHLSVPQKDSLFYELGWLSYTQKKLEIAILYFNKVSTVSNYKVKADFFTAYFHSFLHQYSLANTCIKSIETKDTVYTQFKNFQLAGVALLKKDFTHFHEYANHFTYTNYAFEKEEKNLMITEQKLAKHHKKSPFIAAALSAILPGAGKWYAGKKKEGFGAFLPIITSGILAYEGYYRGGLKDARFLIFGSLFTTFYIGNIWGSSLTVKISEKEFQNKYENKILFDLHIPLRNLFN